MMPCGQLKARIKTLDENVEVQSSSLAASDAQVAKLKAELGSLKQVSCIVPLHATAWDRSVA